MKNKKSNRRGIVSFQSASSTEQADQKLPRARLSATPFAKDDRQSLPVVSGLLNFFRKFRGDRPQASARRPLGLGMRRLTGEPLEQRQLLSLSSVWVNDNWVVTTDVAPTGLSAGDTVDNSGFNDNGSITGKIFGTDAFSSVGAALPNVTSGGTINVITGMYNSPGKTDLSQPVHLIGQEYTSGSTTYNAVMAGLDGAFKITSTGVEIEHFIFRDASSGDGAAIEANAAGYNIHDNTFTQNSVGILANAAGTIGAVGHPNAFDDNNRAGTYRSQGIHVAAGLSNVVTITANTFQKHNHGLAATPGAIVVESGTARIEDNIFSSTNKNLTDVRLDGSDSNLTVYPGNQFSATNYFIENYSPNAVSFTGAVQTFDVVGNFRIEDKMFHKVDAGNTAAGLVTWIANQVYVTKPEVGSTDSSIQRGIDAAPPVGYTVNIENSLYNESDITIAKSVAITGESEAGVIIGPGVAESGGHTHNAFDVQSANVTIQNLTIDGNEDGVLTGDNRYRAAIIGTTGADGLTVQNTTIQNIYRRGIQVSPRYNGTKSTGHLISGNTVDGVELGPAIVIFDAEGTISTNTISDTPLGIEVVQWSGPGNELVFVDGNIISASYEGIQLVWPAAGSTLNDNDITLTGGNAVGLLVRNAGGTMTVQDNEVDGTAGDAGIWLFGNGSVANPILVKDNTLTATSSLAGDPGTAVGIFVSDDGGIFTNGNGDPVADLANYATLTGNTITGFVTGIDLADTGTNPAGGAPVQATVGGLPADANTISGAAVGINVNAATAKIENNTLTGNQVGIQVLNNATVDAGGGSLGSVGGNDLTGYTGLGGNYAIKNLNTVAVGDKDVYAEDNDFGLLTPPGIEGVIYDDTDDAANTEVIFSQYPPVPTPTVVYVDDTWTGTAYGVDADGISGGSMGNGTAFGYDQFATIQDAIDAVAVGGTVYVYAGDYAENLVLDKALSLLGPNAAINPNTGTPVAPTVLMPATSDPSALSAGAVSILYVSASNITIKGLTFDGDNPTLTSGFLVNGVDVDACEAVSAYDGIGNVVFENNIVENISYAGVDFYNYYNGGAATSDNYIRYNRFENIGYIPEGFGVGVIIYNNFYAEITDNVMLDVRKGVQTGNFSAANPGATGSIANNEIHATRFGIFHNLAYSGASSFTISGNQIYALDETAGATKWDGIILSSLGSSVGATVSGNTIVAPDITQTTTGYQVWNDTTTLGVAISGGSVSGADYGVWLNNYEGYSSDGGSTVLTIDGLSISGASLAGVYVKDSPSNTNGSTVHAVIQNDTSITACATGILVEGADASALVQNNSASIHGNAIGIDVNAGLANITNNHIYDNTIGVRFINGATGSVTGNTFDDNGSKQFDGDATTLSMTAGILAGNTFDRAVTVTTLGSISVPAIFSTIQGGIDAVTTDDTVKVESGTYDEDVSVNKSVSLLGAGAGATTIRGVIGGSGSTVAVTANDVEIAGFTITRLGNNPTDWNNAGLNSAGISIIGTSLTGMLVRDNLITGNRTGIDVNNSSGHTIRNNVITDNRTGMIFRNQTDSLTVEENEITDNWTVGVLFLDASGGTNSPVQTAANCTFFNNDLSGNWYGQVVDRQTGGSLPAPGSNLKNISGNWYGTANPVVSAVSSAEPGYSDLIPVAFGGTATPPVGQPDILGSAAANIDYTPWLLSGSDTNGSEMGFQGDFSQLKVDDNSPQTGSVGRIQEAIDMVDGSTVYLNPGNYVEPAQIVVNKDVAIIGAGMGVTTVKPGFDTGSSGDARGWWLVNAGKNLDLSQMTLDGAGREVAIGILHKGDGTIDHVEFKNIALSNPALYYGRGVAVYGGDVDITDSTFANIGRIGAFYFGAGTTGVFQGNTYTGKGAGDWLDYGIELGGGADVTIGGPNSGEGNTFTGNTGVATVDGSTSAGILITTYFGAGTQAEIVGNHIYGNTTGVAVGYDDTDTSTVTLDGNIFHGSGGNDIGIAVVGGSAKIQNNDLTENDVGIQVDGDATVDAGGGSFSSAGNNDLTGYTGTGGNYAIENLNKTVAAGGAGIDVKAQYNDFGPYVDLSMIEHYVFDDTDDADRTMVDFSNAQNQAAAPMIVYVNDDWAGLALGVDPDGVVGPATQFGVDAFDIIQDGVNAVAVTGTVNVLAGTYAENVVVHKSVEIAGAGEGVVTVVPSFVGANVPGGSLAVGSSNVFLVQANDVTIHDLTVDGDNLSLPGGESVGGANVDARNGIITNHNLGVYNGLSVHDVTIRNIYLRGLYASSGGTFDFTENTVDNVQGSVQSIGIFNFGGSGVIQGNTVSNANDAIAANWSTGTDFLDNVVTDSGSGIHTDNSSGGDLIEGNTVSDGTTGSYGIWTFAPYGTITVQYNTVTNVDVGLTASGGFGGSTNFIGNTVDGTGRIGSTGVYATTSLFGWGDADVNATFTNNFIKNTADGVYVEETSVNIASVTLFENSFSGNGNSNVTNAGTTLVNASGNWWDASTAGDVAATIVGDVDYTPWLNLGTDVGVAPGFQGDFSSLSVDDDSPQSGALGRIQEAVDLVDTASGGTIDVYAGDYAEGSLRDWHTGAAGATAVGLIVYESDLTIQGVDAAGVPITNRVGLPTITATMRDPSLADHIVSGDGVTLTGLRFQGVPGDLGGAGPNKTVMDIGDDFTLANSIIDNTTTGWSALYISNEWLTAHVESFNIHHNEIIKGEITVINGAGQTNPTTTMALRKIQDNDIHDVTDWAGVSLTGMTTSGWATQPIGAVTITGNTFTNNAHQIMARGDSYANPAGYWTGFLAGNTFDKAVVALTPLLDAEISSYERLGWVTPWSNFRLIGTNIQEGIDRATAGDTVRVLAGTYNENQVVVDKGVTVQGDGIGLSIIDGDSAVGLLDGVGLVRITASGDVTFDGFSLQEAGTNAGVRVGIYAASPLSGATYNITHNEILGTNNPADDEDYGFYSNGGLENLVFQYNEISQTGSNAILLERHFGATDVSFNTFDRGVADGSVDAYFNMNYGGTNIVSLQKVHDNVIDMGTNAPGALYDNAHRGFGITFASDFTNAGADGGFSHIEISDNQIANLKAYRRGIGLWNNGPGSGASGNFTGVVISGNVISGDGVAPAGSQGIRILGKATGMEIANNDISDVNVGIRQQAWNGHAATATQIDGDNDILDCDTGIQILAGSAIISDNDDSIHDNRVGIDVDGGTALIENNDLTGNDIGLLIQNGGIVDAGQLGIGTNFTGLGVSAGGNDFRGYTTSSATEGAIVNLNADPTVGPHGTSSAPYDVTACGNTWDDDTPSAIEALIYHDSNDNAVGFVDYAALSDFVFNLSDHDIDENDSITLTGSFINDPQVHTLTIAWGDGQTQIITLAQGVFSFSIGHTYADDNPSTGTPVDVLPFTVTLVDSSGGAAGGSDSITLHNVAPVIDSLSATSMSEDGTVTLSGTYHDDGTLDTHTLTIDWGEGAPVTLPVSGGA
ncbi:MAG: right-handed parallel beta-helix repeat-containing protein, partial [Pirellulales bacterium]|nr:right-handed parallel beta-helix repeat-containing protein [Pirellulales bacterium]